MSEGIQVTDMGVSVWQSLNISKYIPKARGKLRNPKYKLFSELEECRQMSCDFIGKTTLFKSSCFNSDSDCSHDGQIMSEIHYKDFDIFTRVTSLRGCPYSIAICNENNDNIDFAVNEFSDVCEKMNVITRCLLGNCECHLCFLNDKFVHTWGGAMELCFSIETNKDGVPLGLNMNEKNDRKKKQYMKQSGHYGKSFPFPILYDRGVFIVCY